MFILRPGSHSFYLQREDWLYLIYKVSNILKLYSERAPVDDGENIYSKRR